MIRWERGIVLEQRDEWPGVQRVWVRSTVDGTKLSALVYLSMTGRVSNGQSVLLNTNAVRRGLGTGGDAFVVSIDDENVHEQSEFPAGHMMKARYTPVQMMVDAIDDPSSSYHDAVDATDSLDGLPIIVADLHSSLAPIVAGIRSEYAGARIVYVHTDWASLPVAYSRVNAVLRETELIDSTISAGQAFGGDHEAVSIPSALAAAHAVEKADVVVVSQGPGNLGTGTQWGYSGIAAADVLNQASAMGGTPSLALRTSNADPRERHTGLSHHSSTVLERMALCSVTVPLIHRDEQDAFDAKVEATLHTIHASRQERGIPAFSYAYARSAGLMDAIRDLPVRVSTMGRGLDDDPKAFLYSAVAGRAAAITAQRRRSRTAQ